MSESKFWKYIESDTKYHALGHDLARDIASNFEGESEIIESPTDPGTYIKSMYIGSVLSIFPSGKYYAPWSSNVSWKEAAQDASFQEGLEEALEESGLYLIPGEGDPLDLFVCKFITRDISKILEMIT